ncbi:hypothetical protein ACF3NT_06280 [Naumannella halotolerans]|uniref:Uncharacterized protein n=1 Tax=Naumannella halotolerans TaxID=993414 RepID=A0A4R7JAI7_9ACTN|nr:hypothetical protein [Naumannella halotolerans]TDT33647.1 hypothetical protein CLV29_1271 [Naumannella halotolerans]
MTKADRTARVRAAETSSRTPSDKQLDAQGMNEGMRVLAYLISGPLCYGGIGWLADRFIGTEFLVGIGMLVGCALSVYMIIRRYARSER